MSDYLPKVVALVDSAGKLAGVADYDVFGRVNEVTVRKDAPATAAPPGSWMPFGTYLQNQYVELAALSQPARTASQRVKMRVNDAQVNTPGTQMSATDKTWVEAGGAQVAPVWSYYYQYYAGPMYGVKTNWFDVPASGEVSVRWASGSQVPASRYSGATVRSYEYRRYEAGASPTWLPLRFPGQYADEESGLFENWNRFYDPSTGRYSASDPLLHTPSAVAMPEIYGYALNNPLRNIDPSGLAPGDPFKTPQQAATDALDWLADTKDLNKEEWAGEIYSVADDKGNTWYYATEPVTDGKLTESTPSNSPPPDGINPVADYHTHPDLPGAMAFSPEDKRGPRPVFLRTPDGAIQLGSSPVMSRKPLIVDDSKFIQKLVRGPRPGGYRPDRRVRMGPNL